MALQKIRVLLIEDNPADARLLRVTVSQAGTARVELVQATRLSEAMGRLREESFDVALVDLGLPDSQGLDTFIAVHNGAPALPIVVLSGLDDEAVAMEAVQRGAQDYLLKGSVEGPILVRAIRYAIERERLGRELVESVTRQREAEDALRKGQTRHIWLSLYRILGGGASAVLYRAGSEAAQGTFAFLREGWNPRDEAAFIQAMREHFRSAGLCEILELKIDRAARSAAVRVRGNFEATMVERHEQVPVCHFLRGLLAGIAGGLLGVSELVGDEVECQAQGKEACTFRIHPMFG
jgi:DNA-binding NarL/FixJ family response regulator